MEQERNDNDIFIELESNEEDVTQEFGTDDSSNGENQADNSEQTENSKWEGKTKEDILKSYEALEKKLGTQGQELGELRKTVSEKGKGSKTFKDVSTRIEELESKIYSDDFDRFDPKDRELQKEYDKLNREYASLSAKEKYTSEINQKENVKVVAKFKETFSELSDNDIAELTEFAINKLSNDGRITTDDLEASLLKKDSSRYKKFTQLKTEQNERERISNAVSEKQPRMSASGQTNKRVNISELLRNNPGKAKKLLKGLTDDQLDSLMKRGE